MKTNQLLIASDSPVEIEAAEQNPDGTPKGPAKFAAEFYTGGALEIEGWDLPVVVDLAGLENGKVLVANLDHDRTKRVGNFEAINDGQSLHAVGTASAATPWRDEVVNSAKDGYQFQASLEVKPKKVELVKKGQTAEANGQKFDGPLYVTRSGTLKGFAFVTHGADDNTTVAIAAAAALNPEKKMKPEVKKWLAATLPSLDLDNLTDEQIASFEADFDGIETRRKKTDLKASDLGTAMEKKKAEHERREAIVEIAGKACDARPYDIDKIKELAEEAIDGSWAVDKFRLELLEASLPPSHGVFQSRTRDKGLSNQVVEAAICMSGRLDGHEKMFSDEVLQTAHEKFRNGIGLKQLYVLAAEANGYKQNGYDVTIETQRAAFGMLGQNRMQASSFSTFSLPNTLANTGNKFLRAGWMSVDQTPMRIAAVRPVNDFKTITTVSLTGDMMFEQVAADGEIPHGTLGEEVYTNKADTYGKMFAITRTDIVNDDLSALTAVPRRIGRGGMLKLNDIFWAKFLNNSTFFASGNNNVSTDTGVLGLAGLQQADTVFMSQTDPDGNPLGVMPAILLVPTPLKSTALQLMTSEKVKGDTDEPDANVWRGRFRVESSPYMTNTKYTGNNAAAWYLLADPNDLPVIEIAALYGRVEPVIESADASFNVLGVQMRGYSDVGVNLQEFRGGVRADGSDADS